MNNKSELLIAALGKLPESFRYTIIDESCSREIFHDATINIETNAGKWRFHVEVKYIHRKDTLSHLKQHAKPNTLLVCNVLSDSLASYCEQHAINFIDVAGNSRISSHGLTTWITGRSLTHSTQSPFQTKPALTIGTAKLIFALLADDANLNLPFRELGQLAGISLGMVSKGMAFLDTHRHIFQSKKPKKARKFIDKEALTLLWIQQYQHVLRPKLGGIQLSLSQPWQELDIQPPNYWGGEVAASQLTSYLQPEYLQLFTFAPPQKIMKKLRAKPNEQGQLWLVPAFWGQNLKIDKHTIALLSSAELLASGDSRNIETARMINEQYLHLTTFP